MTPFVLIPDSLSANTIECLEALLDQARLGEVTGIAFAVTLKRQKFIVNSAGEARRNPTFARGMVAALDDDLSARVRGGESD